MRFCIKKRYWTGGYAPSEHTKLQYCSLEEMVAHVIKKSWGRSLSGKGLEEENGYGMLTSHAGRYWGRTQHVLVADLDSEEDIASATGYVRDVMGYRFRLIKSSRNHAWMVVDCAGTFADIIDEASHIYGVDREWLDMCKNEGVLLLRAFPKEEEYPVVPPPAFIDPYVIRWYSEFWSYFNGPLFAGLREAILPNSLPSNQVVTCVSAGSI